jgi:hypothetical protein
MSMLVVEIVALYDVTNIPEKQTVSVFQPEVVYSA